MGVGRSIKDRLKLKHTPLVAVVAALLLVSIFVGVKVFNDEGENSDLPKTTHLSVAQRAFYQADKGNYTAAKDLWEDQLGKVTTVKEKLNIYYQQSALGLRFKHYDEAKEFAEKAMKLSPNSPTAYVALAHIAEAEDNKDQAKSYWEKAIAHLSPSTPGYDLIKRDYQASLDALE
jgi:tetratricopeptide (TPR) repeat protein